MSALCQFGPVSDPSLASFPHKLPFSPRPSNNSFPLRRPCLVLCLILSIVQIALLHRRLLPIGISLHSNKKLPKIGSPIFRNESNEWPNSEQRAEQRLPNCLIIGVRKGGTRALLDVLALHPRIRVARHEVHFFDRAEYFRQGPEWYRKQMPEATAKEVVLEKTPAYFTNPAVPKRVRELNPSMKMVLIVREPVTRTISDFTQLRQTRRERHKGPIEFQKMSFMHPPNGSLTLNTQFRPIRNSLYSEHFGRWLEHFSKEHFLVLDGDKFIKDPLSQVRLLERFLHIGPGISPDQLIFNPAKGFFCFRRNRTLPGHCLGRNKGRMQMPVTAQFRRVLASLIRPYNRRFFAQLNTEFTEWEIETR